MLRTTTMDSDSAIPAIIISLTIPQTQIAALESTSASPPIVPEIIIIPSQVILQIQTTMDSFSGGPAIIIRS